LQELASELVALQRKLARAERLAVLGALAGRLAHELGTPLHSIGGHLDLMLKDPRLPKDLRERAQIVADEVDRLCGLLRDYLKRLRAPDPRPVPTDLNALVGRIARLMGPVLEAGSVALRLELDPLASAPFRLDPRQVEQVLLNLVQNALDAMPGGGTLVLATGAEPQGRRVSVRDTGHGIPADLRERVFEPFFTTKDLGEGSGLGLAICLEIARAHGGTVSVDSEPGEGTAVTVRLGKS
jgi:signal transduction histidine kinase